MLKIGICDDEKNIRSYLSGLVRRQGVECEITEYADAEECLPGAVEQDILLLDIELGGTSGLDGMDLAKKIREKGGPGQPVIIFVTGHDRYVYDAFDVSAFQYLVKPVDERRFAEVFRRASGQAAGGEKPQKETLVFQRAGVNRVIPVSDIYYMESRSHKTVLYTKGGRWEYYAKLGDLEQELQGRFFRIHKGYLINLACVEGYTKTEVALTDGSRLQISKYRYADFVRAYLRFMQR